MKLFLIFSQISKTMETIPQWLKLQKFLTKVSQKNSKLFMNLWLNLQIKESLVLLSKQNSFSFQDKEMSI